MKHLGLWLFIAVIVAEIVASALLAVWGAVEEREIREGLCASTALVVQLGLTDLAIWSESRYCRHPSQADLFSSHADHPSALDHFPAGSFVPPPLHVTAAVDSGIGAP